MIIGTFITDKVDSVRFQGQCKLLRDRDCRNDMLTCPLMERARHSHIFLRDATVVGA